MIGEPLNSYFMHDWVPVVYNGSQPFRGIPDNYDQVVLEGDMETGAIANISAVTVKTSDVAGIQTGEGITVNGVVRYVARRLAIQDGALTHLTLSEQT